MWLFVDVIHICLTPEPQDYRQRHQCVATAFRPANLLPFVVMNISASRPKAIPHLIGNPIAGLSLRQSTLRKRRSIWVLSIDAGELDVSTDATSRYTDARFGPNAEG